MVKNVLSRDSRASLRLMDAAGVYFSKRSSEMAMSIYRLLGKTGRFGDSCRVCGSQAKRRPRRYPEFDLMTRSPAIHLATTVSTIENVDSIALAQLKVRRCCCGIRKRCTVRASPQLSQLPAKLSSARRNPVPGKGQRCAITYAVVIRPRSPS